MRLSKHLPFFLHAFLLALPGLAVAVPGDPLGDAGKSAGQVQHLQALHRVDTQLLATPGDPHARLRKGLILAEMNRAPEAIAIFRKMTEDFPELPEPFNNLAVLYAREKQYELARAALEAAMRTHPSYAVAHENLSDIYARLASQAYGKALQIEAPNAVAPDKLALLREVSSPPRTTPAVSAPTVLADAATVAKGEVSALVIPAAAPLATVDQTARAGVGTKPGVAAASVESPASVAVASATSSPPVPALSGTPAPGPSTVPATAVADAPAAAALVARTVTDWATAWARKDVKTYFAYYAPDFRPANGQSRPAWQAERRQRIVKPGRIEVRASDIQATFDASDRATVRFRQFYKSATLAVASSKTLVLARQGERWLIEEERVR